jgi:hypothetical protein
MPGVGTGVVGVGATGAAGAVLPSVAVAAG